MGALPCDTAGDFNEVDQDVDNFSVIEIAASNTGWKDPTTTGETDNNWTNPTNAYTSDNIDATESTTGTNGDQDFGDFGISLTDETIRGVQVKVEFTADTSTEVAKVAVEVSLDNGSTWSSALAGQLENDGADDIIIYGHANYLWGETWTASDTSDDEFRVRVEFDAVESNDNLLVDDVSVRVFYDEAEATDSDGGDPTFFQKGDSFIKGDVFVK